MSLNKVMLIGNVGKDPEIRFVGTDKVANFTLATTESWKDRNGETKETTEWHNIVVWRKQADVVDNYVKKGTQLYIEGKVTTRKWKDQNGNDRYTTEIQAQSIQLLGKKESQSRPSDDGPI